MLVLQGSRRRVPHDHRRDEDEDDDDGEDEKPPTSEVTI